MTEEHKILCNTEPKDFPLLPFPTGVGPVEDLVHGGHPILPQRDNVSSCQYGVVHTRMVSQTLETNGDTFRDVSIVLYHCNGWIRHVTHTGNGHATTTFTSGIHPVFKYSVAD